MYVSKSFIKETMHSCSSIIYGFECNNLYSGLLLRLRNKDAKIVL